MTRPIVSAVDPRILSGLQLWVRADDIVANDGAAVTWIRDHSGRCNAMAQFDTAPVFQQSYLGYPAWLMNQVPPASGFSDFRCSRQYGAQTTNTVWAVVAHTAATFDAVNLEAAFASAVANGGFPNIIGLSGGTQLQAGGARSIYIDGHSFGLNTAGDFSNAAIVAANGDMTKKHVICVTDTGGFASPPWIGRYLGGTSAWVGYIYEVVAMNGVPDATTLAAINGYFASKYGLKLVS